MSGSHDMASTLVAVAAVFLINSLVLPAADSVITFSEIMYHHQPFNDGVTVGDSAEEWIELCNRGTGTVDLMGMLAAGEILIDDLHVIEDPDGAVGVFDSFSLTFIEPLALGRPGERIGSCCRMPWTRRPTRFPWDISGSSCLTTVQAQRRGSGRYSYTDNGDAA